MCVDIDRWLTEPLPTRHKQQACSQVQAFHSRRAKPISYVIHPEFPGFLPEHDGQINPTWRFIHR